MHEPLRILVIDDDNAIRRSLCRVLSAAQHQVIEASDGLSGLKAVTTEQPDLVLTDIEMPGLDGKTLVRKLHALYPELPIIVVSAKNSLPEAIELIRNGAWDYLEKTTNGMQLLDIVIQRVMERARLLRESSNSKLRQEALIHQRTQQLQQEKERYRLLFESAHDAILLLKGEQIIACNTRALQMFAATSDEMTGRTLLHFSPLLQPDDLYSDDMYSLYCQRVLEGSPQNFEWRFKRPGGLCFDAEISLNGLTIDGAMHFQAVIRDISERKLHLEELFHQAHYDELTNLPNRHRLTNSLAVILENLAITGGNCCLFLIDIGKLQHINDTLGHARGDELLQQFAKRLLPLCTFKDALARLVGNEFMLLATAIPSDQQAQMLAQQILELLEEPFIVAGMDIFISAHIGICSYPTDGSTVENLLQSVETALHQAKLRPHGTIQLFNQDLARQAEKRLALENSLHRALERQEFELHFQPQIDVATEAMVGAEILLRWNSPAEETIPPLQFIPILEESGLIIPVGTWLIQHTCQQIRAWLDQGLPQLEFSINISALQFHRGYLVETVREALQRNQLKPELLCLEVTESLIMDDIEQTISIMEQLVELGVSLSIDDFGTGYSSLSYLRRMPIHELKIDRSFIINIPTEPNANALVDTILGMAACLNLRVVAEGVENQAQRDYLAAKKCDRIQGYFYAKPAPAEQFANLLRQQITKATLG